MMKYFALLVLWFLRWDLAFARNTGRNLANIAAIGSAISEWELVLLQTRLKLK